MTTPRTPTFAETCERLRRNTATLTTGRIEMAEWARRVRVILEDRYGAPLVVTAADGLEARVGLTPRARAA